MKALIYDYLNTKYNDVGVDECSALTGETCILTKFVYTDEFGQQIEATEFIEILDLLVYMYEKLIPQV